MTSKPISGLYRKVLVASTLIGILAFAAAAQKIDPNQQGKRYGDAGFIGEPVSLNVVNADVRDILSYITEQYGINFVIDRSVKATPVTVNVSQVPWNIALDSVMRSQDLGIQASGTILRVADAKMLAAEGEIYRLARDNMLEASPLYTEFIRLNYARAAGTIGRGSASSGTPSGSSSSAGSSSGSKGGGGEGLLPIIQRRLSRRGSIETDGRSNSIIVTDVRENLDAVRQLVEILDQPEPQVEIETRIVVATRDFSRDIGVQLNGMLFGAGGSGGQGGTMPGASSGQNFPSTLPTQGPTNNLFSAIPSTVIGLTTGLIGTAQISMMISAGEQKGTAKVIATPRVTALNNREATIESKTQIPINTIQASQGGGVPIVTTTYIDVPLKLQITPQITDVGTVVLEVLAENSSTPPITGGQAPSINTQKMQTQVTVPDGGTTVVGGVLFDDERENTNRTPGISKIPILGNLFKRKAVSRTTNEILFFITPRISRPDYTPAAGSSGTRPTATILQPVPMGNPYSNSDVAKPQPNTQNPQAIPVQQQSTSQPVAVPVMVSKPGN